MQKKIAVNGLGRIGKCVTRILLESSKAQLIAINSNKLTPRGAAYMLQYDSIHGRTDGVISSDEDYIMYNSKRVSVSNVSAAAGLDWQKGDVDIVLECTGAFNSREQAYEHIKKGAKTVIVSAPCAEADHTVILGVNQMPADLAGKVISLGSCTTNCLANIIMPLHESLTITRAFMTTVHAYTNDQSLLDSRHTDLRRGRAAESSIIPTSTGATKVIGDIIPELKGKIDGVAVRVPVQNVSMIDLTFTTEKIASANDIHHIMREAAARIPHILSYCDEPLVSIDFNHTIHSAIFDATQTKIVDKKLYRIVAWYDNEWGFANRMVEACFC